MRISVLKKRTMESTESMRTSRHASRAKTPVRFSRSAEDLSIAMADALEDILRAERMSRLSN